MTVLPGEGDDSWPAPLDAAPQVNEPFISGPPTPDVVAAIEQGTATVTRRVEFYEQDGVTVWDPEGDNAIQSRLVDGSVSVDYGRDERRAVDLSLDNTDGLLRPDIRHGLWYDKVVKAYRGVRIAQPKIPPQILIIEEDAANGALAFRDKLWQLGFSRVDINTSASVMGDLTGYKIIVSYMPNNKTLKSTLLKQAYANGFSIITIGCHSTQVEIPLIATSTTVGGSYNYALNTVPEDTPLQAGWSTSTTATTTGLVRPTALTATTRRVAWKSFDTTPTAMIQVNTASGGRWFHYQPQEFTSQSLILLSNAVNWMWDYKPFANWQTQIGEFCIDNLSESNFPHIMKLTGRDAVKKCMNSKIEESLSFAAGTPISVLVKALGANSGLTKFKVPDYADLDTGPASLAVQLDVERGTPRWSVMKNAANGKNFELFIDRHGYLVMRHFVDPTLGPVSWTFQTGTEGNLTSWERSINDSRLFNHIVVTGERDDGLIPYFGQWKNTDPNSPTRVGRIGDRMYPFNSTMFESDAECREYAKSLGKIYALESYEINWGSFCYPWLEAGDIIQFLDPDRRVSEPTKFLMDTINVPLGLGVQTATGKRVTFAGGDDISGS